MTTKWPIPRPTETAALRNAARTARPLPPVTSMFAALMTAAALDDRHGTNLAGHRIARAGANDACPMCGYWRCRCFEKTGCSR
jgi:hypothetical protein